LPSNSGSVSYTSQTLLPTQFQKFFQFTIFGQMHCHFLW